MKSKLLQFFILLVGMSFSVCFVTAQNNPNYFIPNQTPLSPNSTAFSIFGNYPVSLYSGLPDISIPLYTIESGGLSLPVTLSYHASGIKISDVASWAGLGWSVNTGGNVTRAVMDRPDETGIILGEFPDHVLNPQVNSDLDILYAAVNQGMDTRPDIFSYNLPGHSGSFFFNPKSNYKIQMIPFSPISIIPRFNASNNNALSFTIKDDHSNTFFLGQNYFETTEILGGSTVNNLSATSAWMLEKMVSANKRDTISFSYTSAFISHPDCLFETCTITDLPYIYDQGCGTVDSQPPLYSAYNNTPNINEQQLKTILFKNGKIDFELNASPRADVGGGSSHGGSNYYSLNDIKISAYNFATKSYEVQKTIKFYQSYFGTTAANNFRLRLDSIQILDKAGSIIQHYNFKYNSMVLPNYGSLSRDYWGYYNGKQDGVSPPNGTLIPSMRIDDEPGTGVYPTPNYITIGSTVPHSRDPDSTKMQACMLDTIFYPTGGHTTFTYQTNRFIDSLGHYALAGGLRVTSINSFDGVNPQPITKTYQYNTGYPIFLTSGVQPVNYGFFSNTSTTRKWACANILQDGTCIGSKQCSTSRTRTYYSQSSAALDPVDGTPVGYTSVTEYAGTPSNNIGKTDYTYAFTADQVWDATMSGLLIYQSNFFLRGQLTQKVESMHKTDGSYQVVRLDINSYTAFPSKSYIDVGLAIGQRIFNVGTLTRAYYNQVSPNDANGTFAFAPYSIQSDDNYLTATTTKIYDLSDPTKFTASTTSYHYDDTTHQQVVSVSHNDSRGNIRTITNKYAYNFLPTGATSTGNTVLDTMINEHMYAEPIEKTETYTTPSGTSTTASQLTVFKPGNISGTIVPATISTLSVSAPITNFVPASVVSGNLTGDSRYVQMISFDGYDPKNNITQYTPRNATPTAVVWDHQYELPIAQVKNVPPVNPSLVAFAYTSFEADSKGNWVYTGTPVTDPTAPTGSLVYPLSAGSVTTNVMDNTKSYVISYWSNNGPVTLQYGSTYYAGSALGSSRGWTYNEHQVPALSFGSSVTISGSTSIDELRLYPANAQMTTYAYAPSGLTSIADTKGSVSHFEYDPFQRLKNLKDWAGNIVKNYGYHTYDQTVPNDAMTATFTRNNCPAGTSPTSASWSVPAARYLSSTKTSANAEATYDLNTNGQINANINCGCPVNTISFTLSNSTGISGFQATFSGVSNTYNFPLTGSTTVQVPAGTYTTVSIGAVGSATHTFTLGSSQQQANVHSASFSNVIVSSSSGTLSLSIQ
jgi:hypothetical protein